MPILSLTEFKTTVPSATSLVGLDIGTKTIGVAVSDTLWKNRIP